MDSIVRKSLLSVSKRLNIDSCNMRNIASAIKFVFLLCHLQPCEAGDTVSSRTDPNTILLTRRISLWSRSGAASVKDPEQTYASTVYG